MARRFFEDLTEPTARALLAAAAECPELDWRADRPNWRLRIYRSAGEAIEEHDWLGFRHVPFHELAPADRDLLTSCGMTDDDGALYPEFRAARPGFLPWPVTEAEARELIAALAGAPLAARPPASAAAPAGLLERWERRRLRRRRTWELGAVTPWRIASPEGARPYLARLTAAIDAESREPMPPITGSTAEPRAAALWRAVVEAVETRGHLPLRLRVATREEAALFAPLAEHCQVLVECDGPLAIFEQFRDRMLTSLGEPPTDYSR